MNTNKTKVIKAIIIVAVTIILLFVLAHFIVPIFMVSNTDYFLAKQLNNEYIDSNYDGWRSYTLPNSKTIMLPAVWEIEEDNNSIRIRTNDETIGEGAHQISYDEIENVFASIINEEISGIESMAIPEFIQINSGHIEYCKYTVSETHVFYALIIIDAEAQNASNSIDTIIVFPENIAAEDGFIDIIHAIQYSYFFKH